MNRLGSKPDAAVHRLVRAFSCGRERFRGPACATVFLLRRQKILLRLSMGPVTVEIKNSASTMNVLRLLLLEENASDAARILRELKSAGVEIAPTIAGNQLEFKNALHAGKFDAVVAAWKLPDGDGLEALQILRASGHKTPLVLVT